MADADPKVRASILHLDDSADDAILLKTSLKRAKFDCDIHWVKTRKEFVDALARGGYNVILSDYRMPHFNGDEALKFVTEQSPHIPFIMVTGELGEDRAVETLKRGATDYVLKGNLTRLMPAVERALRDARAAAERRRAAAELAAVKECLAR